MDYSNGKIYKLVSNSITDIYIGSTCSELKKRKYGHKIKYDCWKNGKSEYITSFKLFDAGEVDIVLIESFACNSKDELYSRERYWIDNLECVNKVRPNRTDEERIEYHKKYNETHKEQAQQYYQKNRDKFIEQMKIYREQNKDTIQVQRKKYREEHRAEISIRRAERIPCDVCGKEISKSNMKIHKKRIHSTNIPKDDEDE